MRIPLATQLRTRVGDTSKDARLKNAYAEIRGEQSVVRHRPSARGGVEVGSGVAQGGIGFSLAGVDYLYTVNGDIGALDTAASAGTNWSSGGTYSSGQLVSYGFNNYESLIPSDPSSPQEPITGSPYWLDSKGNPLVSCSSFNPYQGYSQSVETSSAYTSPPTVPDNTNVVTEIKVFSCGTLKKNVITTYALRQEINQYRAVGNTYKTNPYGYGNTAAAAVEAWYAGIEDKYCNYPTWTQYYSSNYHITGNNSFHGTWSSNTGCPGTYLGEVVPTTTITSGLTIYYIDTTITIYYTVE